MSSSRRVARSDTTSATMAPSTRIADTTTTRPQGDRRVERPASGTCTILTGARTGLPLLRFAPCSGFPAGCGRYARTQGHTTRGGAPMAATHADGSEQLQKGLRRRHMTMISLGGVIGAGLFVGSGAVMNQTGPAAILSYLAAGLLVVLIMRMLGEMAVANPQVGSFMEYCRQALGPWAGFSVGWLYWYFWAIVLAVEAVAGATILQRWLDAPVWLMSLVLMTLLTVTNLWSVKSFGEFEFWFASIKVAAIIAFIAIAAACLLGVGSGDSPGLTNLTSHNAFFPAGPVTVLSGVVVVIFAFVGP